MVFRGKPSRACQRCRERKLRCDLRSNSCSSCIRARIQCSGYRDLSTLRVADETATVRQKALSKQSVVVSNRAISLQSPHTYPFTLASHARSLFFASYVADFSHTWKFLSRFSDPGSTPDYLSLSIDAVSLAFLFHQTYHPSALALSRRKYVAALQKTNLAIQCPHIAKSEIMLVVSLLLNLFEELTMSGIELNRLSRAHVDGALALVQLRGLSAFEDEASLKALVRLNINCTIVSLSDGEPMPEATYCIREQIARSLKPTDPKWRLGGLTVQSTNLFAKIKHGELSETEVFRQCVELYKRFRELDRDMPEDWMYERVLLEANSERTLEPYFDVYPDRRLTQTRNVLRVTIILLCEEIACRPYEDLENLECQKAITTIEETIRDICASAPQMTDCVFAARKVPAESNAHNHTLARYLDVYILLFPIYVAAWSYHCPNKTQSWIQKEMEYAAEHFGMKEAAMVGDILRKPNRPDPWKVYRLLGSCAFAA